MNLIDGAKVLIICEISLHISSHLVETATICKTRQGLVGGIVGPGYSSGWYILGVLSISLRVSSAQLGFDIFRKIRYKQTDTHFKEIMLIC